MSRTLMEYPLDVCPKGCMFAELSIKNDTYFEGGVPITKATFIYCSHEHICEYWADKLKGAILDDFYKNSQE